MVRNSERIAIFRGAVVWLLSERWILTLLLMVLSVAVTLFTGAAVPSTFSMVGFGVVGMSWQTVRRKQVDKRQKCFLFS